MLVATGLLMPDFDDSRWTVVRSEIPKPLSSKAQRGSLFVWGVFDRATGYLECCRVGNQIGPTGATAIANALKVLGTPFALQLPTCPSSATVLCLLEVLSDGGHEHGQQHVREGSHHLQQRTARHALVPRQLLERMLAVQHRPQLLH